MNDLSLSFRKKLLLLLFILVLMPACATLLPDSQLAEALTATLTVTTTASSTPAEPSPTPWLLPTSITERPTPAPTDTPGGPSATPQPESDYPLFDEYLEGHRQVAESEHFTFHTREDGYLPVDLEHWQQQAEVIYDYVAQRVQADSPQKIALAFLPPREQACPIRGLASQGDPPMILIFADKESPEEYLFAVLAHEVGHAVPAQGFPGKLPNDLALTEGLATWASGKYWEDWKDVTSLDALVESYVEDGVYLPLNEAVELPQVYPWQSDAGKDCLQRRDQIYSQWGAFVGYLIDRYGMEQVRELFESAHTETEGNQEIRYPSDYPGVFGLALNQLEADWLRERVLDP